jgi:hypothetical protein
MRHALFLLVLIVPTAAYAPGASANFVLQSASLIASGAIPAPPPGPGPVAPATGTSPPTATFYSSLTPGITAAPPPARRDAPGRPINLLSSVRGVPAARGFGHDVPLFFAVRQIVPGRLHVAYANQVDASTLVSWTGGQPWNVVLVHALRPAGLRVWVSATTVHIYK